MSEESIRLQLQMANDMSVPVTAREPVVPLELRTGTILCKDSPILNKHAMASVVKPGEDKTELRLPPNAAVVNRHSDVVVIRQQPDAEGMVDPRYIDRIVNVGGEGASHNSSTESVVYAERPMPSDTDVGVSADLVDNTVISSYSPKAAVPVETVVNVPPITPSLVKLESVLRSEGSTAVNPAPIVIGSTPRTRTKVAISSPTMGKIQARVDALSISDTIIILGFIEDDDTIVIEPPATGAASIVTVEANGISYDCHYFGFTTKLSMPLVPQMLLVVLVRKI